MVLWTQRGRSHRQCLLVGWFVGRLVWKRGVGLKENDLTVGVGTLGRRWGLVTAEIERCNGGGRMQEGRVSAIEGWIEYVGWTESGGIGEDERARDKRRGQ